MEPLIDRAALGVTELLSNVHRHARPDKSCTVELELLPDRLTVSVRDHDPRLPVPANAPGAPDTPDTAPLPTCGRGLTMVAAVSESWGARPDGENGKVVWFTLPAPASTHSHLSGSPREAVRSTPTPAVATAARAPAPADAVPTKAAVPARTVPAGAVPAGVGAPAEAAEAALTCHALPPLRRTAPAESTPTVVPTAGAPTPAVGSAPATTETPTPARTAVPS